MINITFDWKEKKVNLMLINKKVKLLNDAYCGCSAGNNLILHFNVDNLSEEEITAINVYWDSLDEESEEVKTYKSLEDELLKKAAEKESAKQKLLTLGFSEDEISALIGV